MVSEKIDIARVKYKRLDDIYNGIQWRLSRGPESGLKLFGHNPARYLLKIATPPHGIPQILLLYYFDDDSVTIIDIHIYKEES